jgi:hypothetical protein
MLSHHNTSNDCTYEDHHHDQGSQEIHQAHQETQLVRQHLPQDQSTLSAHLFHPAPVSKYQDPHSTPHHPLVHPAHSCLTSHLDLLVEGLLL